MKSEKQDYYSIITGTGSYIPTERVGNEKFLGHKFFDEQGNKFEKNNVELVEKFSAITTITERRHVTADLLTSDIAYSAAEAAIASANLDKETLDYIIVAHNFGDVSNGNGRLDMVPSLAARVKHKLGIRNADTVAYDVAFGCPGWLQCLIQADYYIKSGDAKKILIIGADVLSRVSDPHDRNSMLYADGAGAVILEAKIGEKPIGIITHKTRSDTYLYSKMLYMGPSFGPELNGDNLFLKMNGRKLYQYALERVPQAIKACLDSCGKHINEVSKILIHQANGKMDEAILKRLFALYDINDIPENIMPMTVSYLGNSSVATIPTILDLILKNKMDEHKIEAGDIIVFASVGAGMNINAAVYQV